MKSARDLTFALDRVERALSEQHQRHHLLGVSLLSAIGIISLSALVTFLTTGIAFGDRGVVGGDFLAFYTVSDLTIQGRALEAYNQDTFNTLMQSRAQTGELGMMWQYPPAAFFIIAPLSLLPYKLSYWVWMLTTAAIYALSLRRLINAHEFNHQKRFIALLFLISAPNAVGVIINGQISLLTSARLISAAFRPRSDWLIAGIAAGLLTIKPQLGLLLPGIFIVAGAWKAFGTAAAVTIVLHTGACLVFGPESFVSFVNAVDRLQSDMLGAGALTPSVSMTTVFGQMQVWGASKTVSLVAQFSLAISLFVVITWEWQRRARSNDDPLYLATIACAGAILVTPYAYAYEMAALAPAGLWFAISRHRLNRYSISILSFFWALLSLRRIIPPDFVLQFAFLASLGALGLALYASRVHANMSRAIHR
ncbi:MAG: glycosyltransferase family 87 protein [Henriciella sp.]